MCSIGEIIVDLLCQGTNLGYIELQVWQASEAPLLAASQSIALDVIMTAN